MKFPRALFKKNRDTQEERRKKKEEGRSETYQRSRTTLELSCTVMYGSKRERGNVSTHKFSKVQNAEDFSKMFLFLRRQRRRTISHTASYFNGNKTKRSFPPSSRSGSGSCCSSDGIFFVVCVFIDIAACAFLMTNFKSFGERIVFFSRAVEKKRRKS